MIVFPFIFQPCAPSKKHVFPYVRIPMHFDEEHTAKCRLVVKDESGGFNKGIVVITQGWKYDEVLKFDMEKQRYARITLDLNGFFSRLGIEGDCAVTVLTKHPSTATVFYERNGSVGL